jgi:transposase
MRDKDLYARILGIQPPWRVAELDLRLEAGEVEVRVGGGHGIAVPDLWAGGAGV